MLLAAPLKRRIVALGAIDEIRDAFGEATSGEITRTPIADSELFISNGVVDFNDLLIVLANWT